MIQFVVGLGNPGQKYERTLHNFGRMLIESIAENERLDWKKEKWFDATKSEPVYVRLNCYMNVSGESLLKLMEKYQAKPEQILICYDDFDLPLGTLRIRKKGSAGSHNGVKSIVESLGTPDFPRLRLGIGPLPPGTDPAEFVLSPFSKAQEKNVKEVIETARSAVQMILSSGIESAMNRFNAQSAT